MKLHLSERQCLEKLVAAGQLTVDELVTQVQSFVKDPRRAVSRIVKRGFAEQKLDENNRPVVTPTRKARTYVRRQ